MTSEKLLSKSSRYRGIITHAKNQVYWKATRRDTCEGFYFEIRPKSGLASQTNHSLYPDYGSKEFLKQMRYEHQQIIGTTYNSSKYYKSIFLVTGPSPLGFTY